MKTCYTTITSAIFVLMLIFIAPHAEAKDALKVIRNFLLNFRQSNKDEQNDANERESKERRWCNSNIASATKVYEGRKKDEAALIAQTVYYDNTRVEWEKDEATREKQVTQNRVLLAKFSKERRENHKLFEKNIKEHNEAIEVLKLFREDIYEYFHKPKKVVPKIVPVTNTTEPTTPVRGKTNTTIQPTPTPTPTPIPAPAPTTPTPSRPKKLTPSKNLKKLSRDTNTESNDNDNDRNRNPTHAESGRQGEIELSQTNSKSIVNEISLFQRRISQLNSLSIFKETDQQFKLAELKRLTGDIRSYVSRVNNITSTHERTTKEIGNKHIDNTRGELKRLESPGYDSSVSFNLKTETNIYKLIDGLVNHLKESIVKLTKDEEHAQADFETFQTNLLKEEVHNLKKIKEIKGKIVLLKANIITAKQQLKRRQQLTEKALLKINALKRLCAEKYSYFLKETKRRFEEDKVINTAIVLFDKLMATFNGKRAGRRAVANLYSTKYAKIDNIDQRVVKAEKGVVEGHEKRLKERNELA